MKIHFGSHLSHLIFHLQSEVSGLGFREIDLILLSPHRASSLCSDLSGWQCNSALQCRSPLRNQNSRWLVRLKQLERVACLLVHAAQIAAFGAEVRPRRIAAGMRAARTLLTEARDQVRLIANGCDEV